MLSIILFIIIICICSERQERANKNAVIFRNCECTVYSPHNFYAGCHIEAAAFQSADSVCPVQSVYYHFYCRNPSGINSFRHHRGGTLRPVCAVCRAGRAFDVAFVVCLGADRFLCSGMGIQTGGDMQHLCHSGHLYCTESQVLYTFVRILTDGMYNRIEVGRGILWYLHFLHLYLVVFTILILCAAKYKGSTAIQKKRIALTTGGLVPSRLC